MSRLLRLARKELSESLRDRRTILTLVLMPLLLYPIMGVLLRQAVLGAKADAGPLYRVGFFSEEQGRTMMSLWSAGTAARDKRSRPADGKGAPDHLRPVPEIKAFAPPDPQAALRDGELDLIVRLKPRGEPRLVDAEFRYRADSATGRAAALWLEALTTEGNAVLRGQAGDPFRVSVSALPSVGPTASNLAAVLVPLVLILMTMTGAVYPAIDTTAGERERGTLEILAAAPIPRLSLLLAKYVAVLVVALLTALVNLGTMALTLHLTGLGETPLFAGLFTWAVLGQVLALLVLFALFFSAVLLALTSFARSFKEAQAYLIPLMLFCLAPGVMALLPGLSLQGPLVAVPLLNIVLLARDVFDGTATVGTAGVVVVLTLLYALAAVALAARVFATESVVSDTSGWGDFFRRPLRVSDHAAGSSAMLCLALLFPATFLVSGSLKGLGIEARLIAGGIAQAALFAGFPFLAAWLGRVRWTTGLRLQQAPAAMWLAALLLGLGLWPLVHEAVQMAESIGFSSLSEEVRKKLKDNLTAWRSVSPLLLVLALGVLPAITEELLFRGYLFAAIEGGPWKKIGTTALLFAAFHLFVSDLLAVERLLPSLLMGLALGGLAWASGSVWPGMLLHALHNSLLVLVGVHEPALRDAGWLIGDRVSALATMSGMGLALVGGLIAWRMPRRER